MNPTPARLSLGDVLSTSWRLLAPRFSLLVGLQLTVVLPAFLVPFLLGAPPENGTPEQVLNYLFPGFFLLMLMVGLLSLVATGATVRVLAEVRDDRPVTFADAYGDALAKFFPLLWTQICTGLTMLAALVVLVTPWVVLSFFVGDLGWALGVFIAIFLVLAPLLYLGLRLIFAFSILVMIEDEWGFGAVRRSFELAEGHVKRILGLGLVLACLAGAILIPLMIPVIVVTFMAGAESPAAAIAQMLLSLGQLIVNVLTALAWSAIAVVLYFDICEPEAQGPSDSPEGVAMPPAL